MRTSRKALNPPPGSWRSGKVGRGRAPGFRRRLDPSPGGGHRGHVEGGEGETRRRRRGAPGLQRRRPSLLPQNARGQRGGLQTPLTYLQDNKDDI